MRFLQALARWELFILLAGFGLLTLTKAFRSGQLAGLLRAQDGSFSAGRAQLMVFTVFTAVQYLLQTIQDPSQLPSIPTSSLMVLTGSQTVYLGAKAWSLRNLKKNIKETL